MSSDNGLSTATYDIPTVLTRTPSPEESSFARWAVVVRRRWWIFLLGFLLAAGATLAFVLTRPKSYLAEATIEVAPDQPFVSADGIGVATSHAVPLWENHFRTQEALLRRQGLLGRVLETLPRDRVARFTAAPDPLMRLSETLRIDAVPGTFLIRVSLTDEHPDHASEVVNQLIELFIADSNRRMLELKNGALDTLTKETLPAIRLRVEDAERAIQEFHAHVGLGDIEAAYASLLEEKRRLDERLFTVRLRAIELKSSPEPHVEDILRVIDRWPLDPDAKVLSREVLETRRTEIELDLARRRVALKDGHPDIAALQRQLDLVEQLLREAGKTETGRRDRILRTMREERARALAANDQEHQSLDAALRRVEERIAEARDQLWKNRKLDVELTAARELYNAYLKRQGEVKAMSGAGLSGVRVVDLARPFLENPGRPRLAWTLAAILGVAFGVLAVFLAEQMDDRLASPRDAERAMDMDLLAAVPKLKRRWGGRRRPVVPEDDPRTGPLEPFRRLRTEVVSRLNFREGAKVLAVLSAGYGEGKSTVAVNLARVLAMEGRRVLLFDLDLRQPHLKALLTERSGPGLAEYLRGRAPLDQFIQRTRLPGIDVLGSSAPLDGPAEVAASPRFRDAWETVRAAYDYVIVDTSPVNIVAETAVIAAHSDAQILVVEERRTEARQALEAARRLANHGIFPLGLVVNRSRTPQPRPESPSRPRAPEISESRVGAI